MKQQKTAQELEEAKRKKKRLILKKGTQQIKKGKKHLLICKPAFILLPEPERHLQPY